MKSKKQESKTNEQYWIDRRKKELEKQLKDVDKVEKLLLKHYKRASNEIAKEVAMLFSKYAKDNKLTYNEAKKYLSKNEFKEWRYDIKEYLKLIEERKDDKLLLELNSLAMKSRISRLEELYYEIDKSINNLYETSNNSLQMLFTDTITDTYYSNLYELHKSIGFGSSFAHIDEKMLKDFFATPFYGTNYSERLWRNRQKLRYAVRDSIADMLVQGKGSREVAKALSVKLDADYKNCLRLVNTEHAHFASEASFKSYEETGVTQYKYIATLDGRTCSTCSALDGQVFDVKDRVSGLNAPVIHPFDRCVTIPYYDNQKLSTRAARNQKGESIKVPSNMRYSEWKETFGVAE